MSKSPQRCKSRAAKLRRTTSHPFWDPLRGDPRFEKLVRKAKKTVACNQIGVAPTSRFPGALTSSRRARATLADSAGRELKGSLTSAHSPVSSSAFTFSLD